MALTKVICTNSAALSQVFFVLHFTTCIMGNLESPILVKSTKSEDLNIDFQQYWFVLKRRGLPALSVLGAVLLLVAVAVSMRKPSYTAEGKLLIKRDETSTLTGVGTQDKQELTPLTMQGNPLEKLINYDCIVVVSRVKS